MEDFVKLFKTKKSLVYFEGDKAKKAKGHLEKDYETSIHQRPSHKDAKTNRV